VSPARLKKVARMLPVASNTVASTKGFMPRLRTGRAAILRTCTATVACSPAFSAATVRASRLSLGRCSSSAPTLVSPNASKPSASLPFDTSSGRSSRDGRGQRTGAWSISRRFRLLVEANASGAPGAACRVSAISSAGLLVTVAAMDILPAHHAPPFGGRSLRGE